MAKSARLHPFPLATVPALPPVNSTQDDGIPDVAREPHVRAYRWAILFGVWLLYGCFGLTVTSLAPLVHRITADLGISHAAMGSVLGAWPLVYIASAVPLGALLDRTGPRLGLALAALIIAASGAARAITWDHASLFLAVAVFGLGGPLVSIGAPKLVSLWFEGQERGLAMGIYITGPAIGGIAALALTNSVVMPVFDDDWRAVLACYAAIVLASGVVWVALASHPAARAVEKALAAEPRQSQFTVFRDLLALPAVRIVLVMSVCIFFFNHGLNNWLPEILRSGGLDAAAAGFWAAVPTVVGIAGSLLIPRLATPERRHAIMLALVLCAGAATLLLHAAPGVALGLGLVLQGIARSSLMTVAMLMLVETPGVGPRRAGAAGGLFFSAAEVGGVLGPLAVGSLYDLTDGFDVPLFALTGVVVLLVLLLGAQAAIARRARQAAE